MTAIRKSYLIAIEDGFATGKPKTVNGVEQWYVVPQGFYLNWSGSTQAQSLYGTGAKIRQNSIYGAFQGSWGASYVMDFEHLEFLSILFDIEDNDPDDSSATPTAYDANKKLTAFTTSNVYEHKLKKYNSRRQRSYVIKERVLNIIAGGLYDKETTLKGVLARNVQIARSTSGSQMAAEMSGVFADKITKLYNEPIESFYTAISDPLTQYSCMYMSKNGAITDDTAIEQLDSHSINIETAVSLVYSTCSPIATDFFEDKTTFAWNATAYMNNPTKKFELLSNSGGTLDPKVGATDQSGNPLRDPDGEHALQPMGKNLAPLEYVDFITYSESYRDQYGSAYTTREQAYESSEKIVAVRAVNSTVKNTTTPKGDGSKLQDSLSSVECDEIEIIIRNSNPFVWDSSNLYAGPGIDTTPEIKFKQAAISNVMSATTFPIPETGYSGSILGFYEVSQGETALSSNVVFDGTNGTPDLKGFFVVTNTAMFNVNAQGVTQTDYRLDNLIPKQLTDGGTSAGPSGLIVQTVKIQTAGTGTDSTDDDEYAICPQISGTPSVKRTDYYFIVKVDASTDPATITTGYLCVAVR